MRLYLYIRRFDLRTFQHSLNLNAFLFKFGIENSIFWHKLIIGMNLTAVHFEMKYVQYTELFKENLDVLLPVLTDLVNASLSSGSIDGAKRAHITPLIKE